MRLFLIATFVTIAAQLASASVDCTGLKEWSSSTTYKKGDRVYTTGGGEIPRWECTADTCTKGLFPDSASGLKSWKHIDWCSKKP